MRAADAPIRTKQISIGFNHRPSPLTIAGSDSSAGAGIQADLKTFTALGVYGLTAVTCIVAEVPRKVSRIEPVTARMVREQIEVLLKNFRVGAIKTGLLCSAEIVCAVAQTIQNGKKKAARSIPLVVDPVMIATSGDNLLEPKLLKLTKTNCFRSRHLSRRISTKQPYCSRPRLITGDKWRVLQKLSQRNITRRSC